MSIKQVLDGVELMRTIANSPTLSDTEKLAAIRTQVEITRNDTQDLADATYADYLTQAFSENTPTNEQIANLYSQLNKQELADLIFFYKRSVFKEIEEPNARVALAQILLRIASEKDLKNPPAIWISIANSSGNIDEE